MGGFIVAIFIFLIIGSAFRKNEMGMTRHQRRKYNRKKEKRRRKAEMDAWEDQYAMFEAMMED